MKTVKIQVLGGSSAWTRPSAPECGDNTQGLCKLRLDLGWGSGQPGSGVAIDWGHRPVRTLLLLKRRDGSMYSQAYVRLGVWYALPGRA